MVGEVDAFALIAFELDLTVAGAVEAFAMARAVGQAAVQHGICHCQGIHEAAAIDAMLQTWHLSA